MDYNLNREEDRKLVDCEALLGYSFNNNALLREALTHASKATHRLSSNERLEFLGDSILGFLVCERLFQRFPDWDEGQLTRIKSVIVSRSTCAKIGERMGIEAVLIVGRGIDTRESVPKSLLSNAIESLIAAIYLDNGIESVREVFLKQIEQELEHVLAGQIDVNYKSELQHLTQRCFGQSPIYRLLDERGPDHDKYFLVSASVDGQDYSPAWGSTKKAAEQLAACNAIVELSGQELDALDPE